MTEQLEINSKPYGKVKVSKDQLISFPDGILGFEDLTKYILLDRNEGPFYWLQSQDVIEVAFVIINPMYFISDYKLELSNQDFVDIQLMNDKDIEENLLHFAIVTIPPDDPNMMTANLLGPIIINKAKGLGKQALSLNNTYTVRHNILEELDKSTGGGK